jgi:hypothetical protein
MERGGNRTLVAGVKTLYINQVGRLPFVLCGYMDDTYTILTTVLLCNENGPTLLGLKQILVARGG